MHQPSVSNRYVKVPAKRRVLIVCIRQQRSKHIRAGASRKHQSFERNMHIMWKHQLVHMIQNGHSMFIKKLRMPETVANAAKRRRGKTGAANHMIFSVHENTPISAHFCYKIL